MTAGATERVTGPAGAAARATARMGRPSRSSPLAATDLLPSRWRGQHGRLEVWYLTLTDPGRQLGLWVHHEVVVPTAGPAYRHGWAVAFRQGKAPVLERFGPEPVDGPPVSPSTATARFEPPEVGGEAGRLRWALHVGEAAAPPVLTFPAWAWSREVLPAAQLVPVPAAPVIGRLSVDGVPVDLSPHCRGAVARIYGHGSAERWGWLHADLGGGDVLEIVSATSRRPGLDRLRPLAFVQLRLGGRDWPRHPVAAAPRFRTRLGLPEWSVVGTAGRWRLRVQVTVPPEQSVTLGYRDPDGATATCTNSELADADVVLERHRSHWETAARWSLRGTAHAEVGTRP